MAKTGERGRFGVGFPGALAAGGAVLMVSDGGSVWMVANVAELGGLGLSGWGWAWAVVSAAIAVVWLRRHVDVAAGLREKVLTEADAGGFERPAGGAAEWPTVSMVVAGKDEEANIGRCVEGMLGQDYPRLQVVLADDRSGDRTGAIMDAAAERDGRVTVVHVKELRAGWFGKNNAMREAIERATGEWIVMSDADCAFDSPKLLRAAVNLALSEGVDMLSVLPKLEATTFWERVVQPVAGAVLVFWFPPKRVNNPARRTAYANGAFMMVSRRAYEAIGGHEPVKTQVNEDMHMARRIKEAGLRLRVVRSHRLYRVRMYTGFAQIWRGWSRIFYGCFGTWPRLFVSVLFLSVFSLSPYATVVLSPLAGGSWGWIAAAGGAAVVAQQSVLRRFWAIQDLPPNWALTYPLGAAVCLGMTLNAMLKLGGLTRTTWRGTVYRGEVLEGALGGVRGETKADASGR